MASLKTLPPATEIGKESKWNGPIPSGSLQALKVTAIRVIKTADFINNCMGPK